MSDPARDHWLVDEAQNRVNIAWAQLVDRGLPSKHITRERLLHELRHVREVGPLEPYHLMQADQPAIRLAQEEYIDFLLDKQSHASLAALRCALEMLEDEDYDAYDRVLHRARPIGHRNQARH